MLEHRYQKNGGELLSDTIAMFEEPITYYLHILGGLPMLEHRYKTADLDANIGPIRQVTLMDTYARIEMNHKIPKIQSYDNIIIILACLLSTLRVLTSF